MSEQSIRRTLVPLSVLVLAVGLAPPPAVAAASPARSTSPAPALAQPVASALPAVEPEQQATQPGGGELLDVYSGLEGAGGVALDAPPADGATERPAGVAAEVEAAVDADGEAPVIIRLRAQADLAAVEREAAQAGRAAAAVAGREQGAGAARDAEQAARGQVVVDALQAVARESQPAVRELLADHGAEDVRELWVVNGFAATVDDPALEALATRPDVESVTLDDTIVLDDPGLAEIGEPKLPAWSLEHVSAPDVWGEYGVRGAGVVVGVMDSGADVTHPALAGSWRGRHGDVDASWFVATGENRPEPADGTGHGTHVTGSIVGAPPGEVVGVAPDAEWIAARIFNDAGGASVSGIHAAFEWMLAPGGDPANAPDVVNNSWGSDAISVEFWDDVAAWVAAGIVPIFANGNSGPGAGTVGSPARFPHSIGVGAIDVQDRAAWFTSRGPVTWDGVEYVKPQVSAPGYEVVSSLPGGGYGLGSGTSMAAPHVTGVTALMLSAAPDLTVDQVRQALQATARAESHMRTLPNIYGTGVVDAHAAVTYVAHSGDVVGTVTGPAAATVTAGEASATVDPEDGGYTLRLPAGEHQVTITGYGYHPQTHPVTVTAGGTVTLDATLAAAAPQPVSGTVTGPAGPVPGARVAVSDTPLSITRTDQDGRFALEVAEGSYALRVAAAGHAPATVDLRVEGATELAVALDPLPGPTQPGWAQYQNNPARTGVGGDPLAAETLEPAWTASAGGAVAFSSPVIADGRVFVNADQGQLVAFDVTDGERLWTFAGGQGMRGAPAAAGGTVYTGGGLAGGIYAVDAETGALRWEFPTPGRQTIYTAPVVVDGVVYATTGFTTDRSDTVFAIDAATGDELWSTDIGSRVFFGPAVADGIVVATSAGGQRLVALDADTGAERWSLTARDDEFGDACEPNQCSLLAGPSIADGTVYATTTLGEPIEGAPTVRGSLLAVDAATGALRWEVASHGDGQGTTPAVYGDLVVAGSHGQSVVGAYDRETGEPAWHFGLESSGAVSASIMVSGDGYVVGGAQLDRRVFALDAATGELVWEDRLSANVVSSPAYGDGHLVVADSTGTLHAYHPTGRVEGTVTGPDGPLPATVRLLGTGLTARADPGTGAFEIPGVPPGSYTVEFSHFGFGAQTRTVQVLAAQTATVAVELAPVGDGGLTGTVRDEAGAPVPGATVTLSPAPLDPVVTGEDGGYAFDAVAAGSYDIVVHAPGYARVEATVTVADGETTVADFTLARFDVAVVGDYQDRIADTLEDAGVRVDRLSYAEIDGTVDRYRAVVLASMTGDRADDDPDRFTRILADADAAGTSLVFVGTGGPSYDAIRTLSRLTGDPVTEAGVLASRGTVWLEDTVPHAITASLDSGRVPVVASNSWHNWFDDYSGYQLAAIGNDRDGRLGSGIGYQRRTLDSNHILLAGAAASPWSIWEPAMAELVVDAVSHASDASYGAVAGQVTGPDGEPVPATVEVVDGFERTVADDAGKFELILEPGEYTLRFRWLGAETLELPVTVTAGATGPLDPALTAPALGVVAGRVVDADRDTPVAGATVIVTGLPPVTTGPDGRYVVEDVPGGGYAVEFAADGYQPLLVEGVEVTNGQVSTVDATLARAPGVAVVGDNGGELTRFLEAHSIPAEEAGWEVVDALDDIEVVILNNPPEVDRDEFLAALAAFDQAGVSVIFPAVGWNFRSRGFDLLVEHTGSPSGYGRLSGPEILLHNPVADHPIFAGVEGDPVQILNAGAEAAYFPDYRGSRLADVAEAGADPAGLGIAYDARTPDSVHLLLTGLAAAFRNTPGGNWTLAGEQIFLNAVRWAAAPGMGGFAGTVTDRNEQPIPDAHVEVLDTHWRAVTDAEGGFEIGLPPGEYTVRYTAFGYATAERSVTVAADQTTDGSAALAVGDVGAIRGVVTSSEGGTLAGVEVTLRGTPRRTVTADDGSYTFTLVEPGDHELELETGGHVRTLSAVEVTAGQSTAHDLALRASPLVGIIDDSDFSNSRDRGKEFLTDWGYEVEDIGFDSLDRIGALDLVVANVSDFNLDPGADGLQAFEEAVNRAGVPVLWLAQHERGAIQFLHDYQGDPGVIGQGSGDGTVSARVVQDHPLVAGLPDEFALIAPDGRYTFFDQFDGTTVARLATGEGGELGSTIAYRGRTTGAVDVLLSTLSISTWGAPSTRQSPALHWTPAAERVLVNALAWALDADGIGAEVRGTVQSGSGERIASRVEVRETGRVYEGRAGDGTFLVPLQPGSWTLSVSAFGHQPATVEVTVGAGEVVSEQLTLTADPAGTVGGTVTGPDGAPVAGAHVTVLDTPRTATTGANGGYQVGPLPDGEWTLRVTADGFRAQQLPVTVTAGQTTPVDVQLPATSSIAIVDTTGASAHGTSLASMLRTEGYEVELVPRNDLAALVGQVGDYDLVIFNALLSSTHQEAFGQAVDAAAQAGVSTVYGSQFGATYPIGQLSAYRGDPAEVDWGFVSVGVDYVPTAPHPIFAGYPVGEPIELITSTLSNLNQQWGSYSGWSGETVGHVHARVDGEDLGEAVGYRFSSPTSVEVLLGSLSASGNGWPDERWTADARQIYLNAVAWSLDATQAQLAGVVTGAGEPLAGATVSVAGATAVTGPDGSYAVGLPSGTHTVEVSAFGYATATEVVEVPGSGTVTLDVDLVPLPRGSVTGAVVSTTGDPVPGAALAGTGPLQWTATTGADGRYQADELLEGSYQVTVTAAGYLPGSGTVTVTAGAPATLDVTLQPTDVGVLGDVDGALTSYLRDAGVPAAALDWSAELDLGVYEVVVVNGGSPSEATFEAVLAAADEAEVSLVFTGTWAVDRGGIRLLERYTDRVTVGTQGFGDGPVRLTGFDPEHPVFAGFGADPATLIVEGGYYSVLAEYAGRPLADLHVSRDGAEPLTGLAVGWDWRTAGSVEILLSASAVTEVVGPGLGWTPEGGRLVVDAIGWARQAALAPPATPVLTVDAPVTVAESATVSGEADWPAQVTVGRDGVPVATVAVGFDGGWSAEVPLAVGDNELTVVASNLAGESPVSAPVIVARWVPEWIVRGEWPVHPVMLDLTGPSIWSDPAEQAELVVYDANRVEVLRTDLQWVAGFYLRVLRGLPRGSYELRAELVLDGHLLVIEGPPLES